MVWKDETSLLFGITARDDTSVTKQGILSSGNLMIPGAGILNFRGIMPDCLFSLIEKFFLKSIPGRTGRLKISTCANENKEKNNTEAEIQIAFIKFVFTKVKRYRPYHLIFL